MLPDGRVGFIDFGIVGRISPITWRAMEALLTATATNDFTTMARALVTIGATSEKVDIDVSGWGLSAILSVFLFYFFVGNQRHHFIWRACWSPLVPPARRWTSM